MDFTGLRTRLLGTGSTGMAEFVRGKIAELVSDPQTAENLTPRDVLIGTKRLVCLAREPFLYISIRPYRSM